MNKLKNNLTLLGSFLIGIVGHHFIGKVLIYKSEFDASKEMVLKAKLDAENMEIVKNKLNNIINTNEKLSKNVETLINKHVPESQLSHVNELLDLSKEQCKIVREILDKGPDNLNFYFYLSDIRAAVACEKASREASDAVNKLVDSLNGSNKLVSDFNLAQVRDSFYDYLNSLSLLELSALYHILVLLTIAIISFNVLSAVLGNEIIKFFKLEESFPKLTTILRLRLKFQKYYLTLNFSLLFIIIFASILINLLVLL
jgi:hypothetical protein